MGDPIAALVQNFVEITNLPHERAKLWLQAHDNDAEKAINAYFNNPDALTNNKIGWQTTEQQHGWTEQYFHTDKSGYPDQVGDYQQAQLNTTSSSSLGPGVFNSAAPSRPPSRASIKPGEQPPAYTDASADPPFRGQENHDLQHAMAMSMDSVIQSRPKDSAQSGAARFGPSTRSEHETKGWIIDVATTSTKEIVLTPEAPDRKRAEGTPTYLRPSPDRPMLSAVLKILHSIPMAREALLNRSLVDPDYGFEDEWWNGDAVRSQSPSIVYNVGGSEDITNGDPLLQELQRLMAFLSATCRAYGSADSLLNIGGFSGDEAELLDAWHRATDNKDHKAPLLRTFTSTAKRTYSNAKPWERDFTMLTIKDGMQSLYESMDDMLWSDETDGDWDDTILTATGHVICLRVAELNSDTPCGLRAPASLFLDRYMLRAAPKMKELRRKRAEIRQKIEIIKRQQGAIVSHKIDDFRSKGFDARELLSVVTSYIEKFVERGPTDDLDNANRPTDTAYDALVSELRNLARRIEARLEELNQTLVSLEDQLIEFSTAFVKPSDEPELKPHHEYRLRGAVVSKETLFALEEATHTEKRVASESGEWIWWRFHYDSHRSSPVSCTTVREIEVLKAIRDSSAPFLVYADREAVTHATPELPPPLKVFVQKDNEHFQSELANAGGGETSTSDSQDGMI